MRFYCCQFLGHKFALVFSGPQDSVKSEHFYSLDINDLICRQIHIQKHLGKFMNKRYSLYLQQY